MQHVIYDFTMTQLRIKLNALQEDDKGKLIMSPYKKITPAFLSDLIQNLHSSPDIFLTQAIMDLIEM